MVGGAQPGSKEVSRESHRLLWVGQGYFIWPAHTYTCIPPGSETEARMLPCPKLPSEGGTTETPLSYPDTQPCPTLMSRARVHHPHILHST